MNDLSRTFASLIVVLEISDRDERFTARAGVKVDDHDGSTVLQREWSRSVCLAADVHCSDEAVEYLDHLRSRVGRGRS